MEFTSQHLIPDLRLKQRFYLRGQVIEEWNFKFGFVMPNSTNTWDNIIVADPHPYPPELLSGNVVISTLFYNGSENEIILSNKMRVFYK